MAFAPTSEQVAAVDLAMTGDNLAIEALAGAGKTSTLRLIAEAKGPRSNGQYVAFNKKIVTDAQGSFPRQVRCQTAHSLAYRAVGFKYKQRLGSGRRVSAKDLAQSLGLDLQTPVVFGATEETTEVWAPQLASIAKRTVDMFCQGADPEIGAHHVPWTAPLNRAENDQLAKLVVPLARKIWDDLQSTTTGFARFEHNHYLKIWQLDGPRIDADYILFDESQDADPLMRAIVEGQDHAQRIWVGDSQQSIYSWRGAVNALAETDVDHRTYLTKSFRFGPQIAERANVLLKRLGAPKMVEGAGPAGRVEQVDKPDVWLGRTNGGVVDRALAEMDAGRRVCVQGGTRQVVWFAEEAEKLMTGRRSEHPDLALFASWDKVIAYTEDAHEDGSDLKLLVSLVESYTPRVLINRLSAAVEERWADVTVSTAHKAKGAEWSAVTLLDDFPSGERQTPEELRLLYVAVTRAKARLDCSGADVEGRESFADALAAEAVLDEGLGLDATNAPG